MPNHSETRRTIAPWLLAVGAGAMLSGCVAAVVPIAAGGMLGKRALKGGHKAPAKASPAPAPTVAPPPPKTARTMPPVAEPVASPTPAPPHLTEPVIPGDALPTASATATTWDAVARTMAKLAARTPDPRKVDVMQGPADGPPVLCGAKQTAVAIDTATLGSGDGLYVGALYTMGFEIVLMAPSRTLPASEVKALAKQGIPTPVPGKTLFVNAPGGEDAARAAIARQYCIVGLVGDRAAIFPGHITPGMPKARDGWFYIPRH